jgi:hypothetical protein
MVPSAVENLDMPQGFRLTLAILVLAAGAMAQNQDGIYQLGYATNLSAGDSTVNLSNSGAGAGDGDMCANVYVFAEDQQLIACCSCFLSPNHLETLSVRNDLINNTLTPGMPTGVTIALLGSSSTCNAALVTAANLNPGVVAWGTTVHAQPGGGYATSEYEFKNVTLTTGELLKMTSYCAFIQADGSGHGICGTCQLGAAGAAKQ